MSPQIERPQLGERLREAASRYPITVVLGARQTGKTSLCRGFASSPDHYFDLEHSLDLVQLTDNPLSVLGSLEGTVVVDEAQELPALFKTLRVLADRPGQPARFLVTGSVAPTLLESVSESLAGRAAVIEMGGFDLRETGVGTWRELWLRGGHPPSFLAASGPLAFEWRENYLSLLIGKDLRIWSQSDLPPVQVRKLLELVAETSGRAWNHSAAAGLLGVSYKTVQRYVETLKGAFLVRELPPLEANVRKRLRRSPTLLLRDTGILHNLLRIGEGRHLDTHPRRGFSWEAFCIDQIIRLAGFREEHCFRYAVQGGAEVDLVVERPRGRIGFEFKVSDAPKLGDSARAGCADLELQRLYLISPGAHRRRLDDGIEGVGIERLPELCEEICD